MIVPAGQRDTLVTFMERTGTQDAASGAWTYEWDDVVPGEWAEVQDILPTRGEALVPGIDMASRPCRVRTLYRADVTAQMRLRIGDRTFDIVAGPAILGSPGRPEGLEMVCVEYSSQGDGP